ncbi:tryptophan halogenase family protein [Fretibacter rubidus]|uniref:tryptophan halogenase family protein n=1 Tax=Fretibacter rubidus TaxID=570162 RepID=UPI00352A4851
MTDKQIKNIVIIGGGTAGWMAAAALSKIMGRSNIKIYLVESEAIGTVGVGEATIPQIALFNDLLGINENEFMAKTQATFKLGIEFKDWSAKGDSYIHPFGGYGVDMEGIHFHHFWLRLKSVMGNIPPLSDFCLQAYGAARNKFTRPMDVPRSPLSKIHYAFQFDAGLYAKFLRELSEKNGVTRTEGRVTNVVQDGATGHITSVTLEDGTDIKGDFFIDCTGFIGLLISKTLGVGYDDWSEHLPVNRAVAIACRQADDPIPYTRATARDAGWQWRIPLQHRLGNGYVYCDRFLTPEQAEADLRETLEGEPLAPAKHLKFTTGIRDKVWHKNCLALGLSAGFMEPLESTSIHLIQTGLSRLMSNFPDMDFDNSVIDYYNERTRNEYIRVRDFLVLHYKASTRDDTPFWRHVQSLPVSDKLAQKMDVFKSTGRVFREDNELFNETSWLAVMHGQKLEPKSYHPVVHVLSDAEIKQRLEEIRATVINSEKVMPRHIDYINEHCKAESERF